MTTKHQLSFHVSPPGDADDAAYTARSVIDEHCIVDRAHTTRSHGSDVTLVVIYFTAANENEAVRISHEALKAAAYRGSVDTVYLKHTTTKKGR